MPYRRTPPLSFEGTREVLEEMSRPPEDTPERRRLFELVREMKRRRRELGEAYIETENDVAYLAEMAEIDQAFDVTVGDGLD